MLKLERILVDVDSTAPAQPALERAIALARRSGATVRIVDVVSPPRWDARLKAYERADEGLSGCRNQLARLAHSSHDVQIDFDVLVGRPADALVEEVERGNHDLVVRAHSRDLNAGIAPPFGSTNAQLVRRAPATVWVVGPGAASSGQRIAAAVDVSAREPAMVQLNVRVVELARLLARLQGASLTIIHAWQPIAEKQMAAFAPDEEYWAHLDNARRRAHDDFASFAALFDDRLDGVRVELRRGAVDEAVTKFVVAEGIDVLVVGTVGRTGLSRYVIGNTVERLLGRVPCSVVAAKLPRKEERERRYA